MRPFLMLFFIGLSLAGISQVQITPLGTQTAFVQLDQLFQATLTNLSATSVAGHLEIEVVDQSNSTVIKLESGFTEIAPNTTSLASSLFWPANAQFGSNTASQAFQSTGFLPAGNFTICYRFLATGNNLPLGVNCSEKTIGVFGNFQLTSPFNQESISTTQPLLVWQPFFPSAGMSVAYNLHLVEVQEGQTAQMALLQNAPLVSSKNITGNNLPYPVQSIPLERGHTYAWQVTAVNGQLAIQQTDRWTFTIIQNKKQRSNTPEPDITYRAVKPVMDGGYYLMQDTIRFSYENQRFNDTLSYKIYQANDYTSPLSNLPSISLTPGLNQISIFDISIGLVDGEEYILRIEEADGRTFFLPFKYSTQLF